MSCISLIQNSPLSVVVRFNSGTDRAGILNPNAVAIGLNGSSSILVQVGGASRGTTIDIDQGQARNVRPQIRVASDPLVAYNMNTILTSVLNANNPSNNVIVFSIFTAPPGLSLFTNMGNMATAPVPASIGTGDRLTAVSTGDVVSIDAGDQYFVAAQYEFNIPFTGNRFDVNGSFLVSL